VDEITRSDDLRRENQRRVLAALRASSPQSRTELSAATGLSASTTTAITSSLLTRGFLVEAAPSSDTPNQRPSRRGRPQVALALNPGAATIAALAITLNRLSVSLFDYSGELLAESTIRTDTRKLKRDGFFEQLGKQLEELLEAENASPGPLSQIVVAFQGTTDSEGTSLQWSPITPHREIALAAALHRHFRVPVRVENDANMIAGALRADESSRFGDSFAAILLSPGVGMGMYVNDRLFTGIFTSAAEFGHMRHIADGALCRCGRHGCIEAYSGDYGIWRNATGGDPNEIPDRDFDASSMSELAQLARSGSAAAREAYRQAGEAIGQGLGSLFALFDPMPVAFVGSGTIAFDLMEPTIRKSLGRRGVGLSKHDAKLYCYANDLELIRRGAVVAALNALDRNPGLVRATMELEDAG